MSNKVYIPQVPTRYDHAAGARVPSVDLNAAAAYGEFVRCVSDGHYPDLNGALAELRAGIAPITEDDFILAVGDVVLTAAAICEANRLLGAATVLRWDKYVKSYNIVEVCLE